MKKTRAPFVLIQKTPLPLRGVFYTALFSCVKRKTLCLSLEFSIDIYGPVCDNPLHKENNRIHEYRNGKGAAFSEGISPESAFAVFYVITPVIRRKTCALYLLTADPVLIRI